MVEGAARPGGEAEAENRRWKTRGRKESLRGAAAEQRLDHLEWIPLVKASIISMLITTLCVAAKQEAFEESIRLKNQFRALEDDEVDFLDSVLESTRAKEAAIRQETTAQLDSFRKQQEAVEKAALDSSQETAEDTEARSKSQSALWSTTTKKRRREQDQTQRTALKLRKASSPAGIQAEDGKSTQSSSPKASSNAQSEPGRTSDQPPSSPKVQTSTSTLGLVSYDSDDE